MRDSEILEPRYWFARVLERVPSSLYPIPEKIGLGMRIMEERDGRGKGKRRKRKEVPNGDRSTLHWLLVRLSLLWSQRNDNISLILQLAHFDLPKPQEVILLISAESGWKRRWKGKSVRSRQGLCPSRSSQVARFL